VSSGSEQAPSRFDDRPVHELFEKQAAHTPDRIAVVCDGRELSYRAVSERANQLAHRLRALGVGPEMLVAVCLERSLELVVTILGILKAGAAYVPLDPESPPERLASLLQDASVAAVVAHAHLLDRLPPAPPGLIVVDGERPWFDREPVTSPTSNARSSSLAYVIYTSGSTGTPKGVLVEHRSVVSLFRATERLFRFGADDVWTLFHSAAFDFSVWEIWGALLHGARLVVVPRRVAQSRRFP
jgi:non-ribosomal peptide synthetase component F